MNDNLPPIVPRNLRTRVAVPMEPPVLRPSLIPQDVLRDLSAEAAPVEPVVYDGEPTTAPQPMADEVALLAHVEADPEVALLALQQVAQFRALPRASLQAMAHDSEQLVVGDGEVLFVEGDDATSFFVVVDGTLEVLRHKDGREVALRHMGRGEAIGLFGLFSGQLRAASARAIGDCTVLELSGERLAALLEKDDALHARLLAFYRERLIEGFMASRLFADIDQIARARLIGRFQNKELEAGEALVNPGEVANVLAVVTHGRLLLEDRAVAGAAPRQLEVPQGQFLAVTCAMSGLPSKFRITAPEYSTVAVLAHKDLNDLVRDYPALRALPSRLPNYAKALDRDVFAGTTGVPGL